MTDEFDQTDERAAQPAPTGQVAQDGGLMPQTTDQPSQTADAHEAAQSDAPTGYDLGATQPHQTIPSATQPATPVAPSASPSAPQSSSRRPFPIDALPDLREPSAGGNDDLDPADAQSRDEFTTVYDIIDQMEAALSEAKGSLFTPGLVKVDRDEFGGQLDELKKMLPVQLERASALMREAERRLESAQTQANAIVASAQSRAADMIKDANDQAQFLAGQENVTEIARQKARAILDQAQAKANRLTQGADKYCTTVMEGLQAQLGKLDRDVQAGLNVLYERQRTAGEQLPHLDNNDYPES